MSIIKNIAVFKNWYKVYLERFGLIHHEFELIHRNGIRLILRPNTDDLMIVKSNFVTKHYFRDFVPILRESIVVDVGAHIGCFSIMAAKNAHRVLAFEPEPNNCHMLRKNIELNHLTNISVFNMAVMGSSGYQDMVIYDDGSTGTHSLYHKRDTGIRVKQIQTISLETIIEKEGLPKIDFLKLDCEGAEYDIFRTMNLETASKIMSIAMETHGVEKKFYIDIPAKLQGLGFEVRIEHHGGYIYARRKS
jgi:FkbM family methyltransferase